MRRVVGLALVALTGMLALLACGDDDAVVVVCPPDAGPSLSEAGIPDYDAGPPPTRDPVPRDAAPDPPRQTTLKLLRESPSARFLGVTTGAAPHAAYLVQNLEGTFDLEVLPIAGGTPTVLQTKLNLALGDGVAISGGALAWYIGVNADNQASLIHLWSAAAGAKTVTATTFSGLFRASEDGTRVAFSVNATKNATDLAVTTMAAPTASATITGASAMNLAISAQDCPTQLDFRGASFIGAYCTDLDGGASQPLLVTVGADGLAVVRLDNTVAANDFDGTWTSDPTGTKILVNDAVAGAHLVDATTATNIVGTIAKVDTASVLPDGAAALFLLDGALKKATFASPPVVTDVLPNGVTRLLTITNDAKTLVYAKTNTAGFNDLYSLDLSVTTPTPVVLRNTATHVYFGLTGTQSHAFVIDTADAKANKVYAVPIKGGAPVLLVDPVHPLLGGLDLEVSRTGTGLVFTIDSDTVTGTALERSVLGYVDALKGGGLEPAKTILRAQDERGRWSGNTYIFRDLGTKPGIYALTLP